MQRSQAVSSTLYIQLFSLKTRQKLSSRSSPTFGLVSPQSVLRRRSRHRASFARTIPKGIAPIAIAYPHSASTVRVRGRIAGARIAGAWGAETIQPVTLASIACAVSLMALPHIRNASCRIHRNRVARTGHTLRGCEVWLLAVAKHTGVWTLLCATYADVCAGTSTGITRRWTQRR